MAMPNPYRFGVQCLCMQAKEKSSMEHELYFQRFAEACVRGQAIQGEKNELTVEQQSSPLDQLTGGAMTPIGSIAEK